MQTNKKQNTKKVQPELNCRDLCASASSLRNLKKHYRCKSPSECGQKEKKHPDNPTIGLTLLVFETLNPNFRPWLKELGSFDLTLEFCMPRSSPGSLPEVWRREMCFKYKKTIVVNHGFHRCSIGFVS